MKKIIIISAAALAPFTIGCNDTPVKIDPQVDGEGKFLNYIRMSETSFMDGNQTFYPMVMNYSLDAHSKKSDSDTVVYGAPRSGYHPNYGKGKGESMGPWTNDPDEALKTIGSHFSVIKEMGFNTLRVTGFTSTDAYKDASGFHTWAKLDVGNTPVGNRNLDVHLIPAIRKVVQEAEKHQLRVILLLSAVESKHSDQENFYAKIAEGLKDEKAMLAYDLYNEPLYFDKGEYTKQQTKAFVEDYNNTIKSVAPNHLTTIGLSHYKIVFEWDPEMMDVDFLSFHVYPYASKNLSKLERFDAKLYWMQESITKPWIVGETGLNTAKDCEPLNFSWGTYEDQLEFMSYSLQKVKEAGGWGYSWWSYQDMAFPPGKVEGTCGVTDYGLVDRTDGFFLNAEGDTVVGALKHEMAALPFKSFLMDDPYCANCWSGLAFPEDVYYNIDYLPKEEEVSGEVLTPDGTPIENAIVTIHNANNGATYTTFSKSDGSFLLYTGWTNVLEHLNFEIRVAAVGNETKKVRLKETYKGSGPALDALELSAEK